MVTKDSSINYKIDSLGIKAGGIHERHGGEGIHWEYNGKKIPRPVFRACWKSVKENFGIDSELLKFEDSFE